VGIDLGTTNSAVAAIVDGKPVIIRSVYLCVKISVHASISVSVPLCCLQRLSMKVLRVWRVYSNKLGAQTTPSVVSFARVEGGKDNEVRILVGEEAREQAEINSANTFASVKRLIGRSIKEASGAVADAAQLKLLVKGPGGALHIECDALGRTLAPEEISCHVIRTLLEDVEREMGGEKVTRAVITVPAYFNDQQRRATGPQKSHTNTPPPCQKSRTICQKTPTDTSIFAYIQRLRACWQD
jgi:heat shock protein 1/8